MDTIFTTPFEDLVLGSQFLPLLTQPNALQNSKTLQPKNIGIFQCCQCEATFLQVEEALIHYKFHVFESHKNYFSVVVGGLCPHPQCAFASAKKRGIHFHCTYCSFTACEILQLPLHMEHCHLAFYKEVSLVLHGGDNVQLNKVFKCGECDLEIQGSVSIVQHLLSHESTYPNMDDVASVPNGKPFPLLNGNCDNTDDKMADHSQADEEQESEIHADDKMADHSQADEEQESEIHTDDKMADRNIRTDGDLQMDEDDDGSTDEKIKADDGYDEDEEEQEQEHISSEPFSKAATSYVNSRVLLPFLLNCMKDNEDQTQTEINPMDLISTLMEEDQKSDCPLFPTQHFLLGQPQNLERENAVFEEPNHSTRPREEEPSPEFLLNGFRESYFDQSSGVFQCNQCNEAFKYQYLLAAHRKKVHQGHVLTPYKCHLCSNEFAVLGDLKRHMVNHSSDYCHFCQVCGHAFTDPNALKSHLVEHNKTSSKVGAAKESLTQGLAEKPSKCDSCSEEFQSNSELTRHIVKYQGTCNPDKAESLPCATCSKQLNSLEDLKEHRKTAHPPQNAPQGGGKKGFQCDYCGKTFSCRSNLRDHLVVHTGEKPYPCDICGKSFSFIHNMKTHRLTHNEGRNEVCPYCDKAYKSKISLYYHMKKGNCRGLSTKEVPEGFHRCTECLQMFASEERYQIHKSKGHCQMSYRCVHCGIRCSSQEKLDKHLEKGLCYKPQSSTTQPRSSKSKQRRSRKRESASASEASCERCNCDRDCCCTFACPACGKRVFSIAAYSAHRKRTCPALRQRKERLRAAIMEKRKRRDSSSGAATAAKKQNGVVEGKDDEASQCEEDAESPPNMLNLTTFANLISDVNSWGD